MQSHAIDHDTICGHFVRMKKPLRIRLPFGTLKVANYLQLSSAEQTDIFPIRGSVAIT